jgi:hypothetical protein
MAISVQATLLSTSEKELVGVWGGECAALQLPPLQGIIHPPTCLVMPFYFVDCYCLPIPRSKLGRLRNECCRTTVFRTEEHLSDATCKVPFPSPLVRTILKN